MFGEHVIINGIRRAAIALVGATDSSGNPAGNVTESPATFLKYSDATYEYFCEAAPGTARSTAVWRVLRKTIATSDMVYAGTGLAEHAATDIATVAALTYTLGA